ncbi:hypothetical protein FDC58_02225 [Clostridium botulinum]|uniref:hypothetical protein n=1 Tax=Clostridium TaxID=1485 RepID=UPI000502B793|nr:MULTISPECIES: hypothetical protein [unclassified Clostridium]AIY78839.1 hypothetical protein U728_3176 [Clostridium botulinum 202F]KAI3346426.1 hypothetical protein CIT17_09675 [Clostridium botulinum]KFX54188.1 hypothetical protein KU40_15535 [Clostridium botulinum]KON13063.1 hypothetical protein ACP50_14250 [Clostridium botulinum]MBY6779647.1 hypothetical protein [Clostridium botulinum]
MSKNIFNLKKNCFDFILFFTMSIIIFEFTACNILNQKHLNGIVKEMEDNQIALFTELAYASKDRVIFYGTIGLIVYDVSNKQIYRAINLKDINMNHIQGDEVTIFKVKEDGSEILIYNDSDHDNAYLYNIENDKLSNSNISNFNDEYKGPHYFEDEYNKINYYNDECIKKYGDIELLDYAHIDENNMCYLIYPSENNGSKGLSNLKILIVNKEANEDEVYEIF